MGAYNFISGINYEARMWTLDLTLTRRHH